MEYTGRMINTSGEGGMKQGHPDGCHCMGCRSGSWCGGRCHGGWWMVIRIVILLVLIGGAFVAGVKFGEFKAALGGGWYGSSHSRHMINWQDGYRMMGPEYSQQYNNSAPATPQSNQLPQ